MVRIEGTQEVTHNNQQGTIYMLRVLGISEGGVSTRAKGALAGRFPTNIGKLEVVSMREVVSDFPGVDAYVVSVFMPHHNPANKERLY